MEILQNLWNVLITEDEVLTKYICLPLVFIEQYVTMKLFTSILDVHYSNKQRNLYIIIMSVLTIFSTLIIPKDISIFMNLIITPILIKLIFRTSIVKCILAVIFPMLVIVLLETIYAKLSTIFFGLSLEYCLNTIIFRIPFMLFIYFTIYFLSKVAHIIRVNLNIFEYLNSPHKRLLILNLVFIIVSIAAQFYLVLFYNDTLPLYITLISLLSLIAYSIISIYSITKTITLELTKKDLEQMQLHNKTLEILYENIRAFKHDFSNIITALGGFIYTKDMNGLEKYYLKLIDDCSYSNNLSSLNPKVINNPAVYNILANKYYKADELGIKINLDIFIDLNTLKLNIYDFTRILGILLDNSIEASSKCDEKVINISFSDNKSQGKQILNIENTYENKDVKIDEIFKKGYTSKTDNKENHGIGLWQVSKIIKKNNNTILHTNTHDKFFEQELVIYY